MSSYGGRGIINLLALCDHGFGYTTIRSPYTPYSIYLRGTINNPRPYTLNSGFHFLLHYPYITPIKLHILSTEGGLYTAVIPLLENFPFVLASAGRRPLPATWLAGPAN